MLSVAVPAFGVGAIALGIRDWRRAYRHGARAPRAVSRASVLLVGIPASAALGAAGAVLLIAGFLVFTSVFSVWLLNAVYELDEARETRTRLAVAEERLRFGRDLHDVMGRNLAVIALKSELAVQLARRGRPEAVEQMIEVQRIAQESQREVREVVRGYREADLSDRTRGRAGRVDRRGHRLRGQRLGDRAARAGPVGARLGRTGGDDERAAARGRGAVRGVAAGRGAGRGGR